MNGVNGGICMFCEILYMYVNIHIFYNEVETACMLFVCIDGYWGLDNLCIFKCFYLIKVSCYICIHTHIYVYLFICIFDKALEDVTCLT